LFRSGAGAYAQNSQEGDAPLEEVIVTGFRGSLELALEAKRESVNFTDSISAEDVGKLPDNNLAEALQRVPGVQISRTNGEGQQLSLRGMGPSFARAARRHADLGGLRGQRRPTSPQPRVRFRSAALRNFQQAGSLQDASSEPRRRR